MATVYHRDQPGAPALTYDTGVTTQAHFDAFRAVLKACLVDGYGSTPAAGWELIHDASNSLILRNGSHSGYVCFQRSAASLALITVWLAATYSGVDADGKIVGDGVRSGNAASSATPQKINLRSFVARSVSCTWSLIADDKTFCFSPSASSSASDAAATGSQGNAYEFIHPVYCGEDSAGDFICVGGVNNSSDSGSLNAVNFNYDGFTALRFPDSGLLVDTSSISVAMPGCLAPTTLAYFTQTPAGLVLPEVNFSQPIWVANGVVRKLRGFVFDPRIQAAYDSTLSTLLGGPALTTRTMNTVLNLGDGYGYIVARKYYVSCISFLITNNPEFW